MKKRILFVMNNLQCGGAEKSLISLLETLDYTKYEVDLLLFKHEGIFMNKIPKLVNLLVEPEAYRYFDMSIKTAITDCIRKGKIGIAWARLRAGFIFRSEKNRARCEQRVWKHISRCLSAMDKYYDVAIGYLEKNPVYYCIDKVNANNKIAFIHTDYDKLGMDSDIDKSYFHKLDHIVTVSEVCGNVIKQRFPDYVQKVKVIHNIVSPTIINKLSLEKADVQYIGINLVSVGRIIYLKGFDLALEACKRLVDSGFNLKWFIIGDGEERYKLEEMIRSYQLQDIFILLGMKENPYPYIKQADIYVQPSRYEGKSIAIDEAKILQKPIVATNFSTVKDQITHEENGLVVDMNSESLFQGIKRLIEDEKLRKKFKDKLSKELLGTESEIIKFNQLII